MRPGMHSTMLTLYLIFAEIWCFSAEILEIAKECVMFIIHEQFRYAESISQNV